jgi:CheY-like chemotaxis protein
MKKILIIDDNAPIRDSLSLIFRSAQYEVSVLPDGHAVIAGQYELPDIFIIDRQLPGIDGLALCELLKRDERTAGIPVIIISASPLAAHLADLSGADAFIEKPYSVKQMRELVARLIG